MRPSVRAREERKWVVDTVNKYFDVIVEDEEGDSEPSSDEGKAMSWIYQEGLPTVRTWYARKGRGKKGSKYRTDILYCKRGG